MNNLLSHMERVVEDSHLVSLFHTSCRVHKVTPSLIDFMAECHRLTSPWLNEPSHGLLSCLVRCINTK